MVMQLEDCIDCLKDVAKISKSFGGKQRSQRDTTIKQEEGYLGPYLCQLNVGDIQKMNFPLMILAHSG
jgi:hypothetical protein